MMVIGYNIFLLNFELPACSVDKALVFKSGRLGFESHKKHQTFFVVIPDMGMFLV